ncbi:MATE family efflux transporter [Deinococcus altitudinis]|uniref:MATE family efflux transporter n=1 Tax=Deinococcus altitudinis TaxID=468914 RepID=UPI003891D754
MSVVSPVPSVPLSPGPSPSPGREIARIAVPVSLEFVFTLVLNFVNQVVVGALGATAIAAVGFANSLVFIPVFTLGALGASVSILVARAYGAGRRGDMNTTVTAALVLAGTLTLAVSLPMALYAPHLLRLTGASAGVAAAGSAYLQLSALALLPTILGMVLSGVMRSLGHARSPMVATFITVILNALLAYLLVFGVGPLPALGVAGAGWATLVTATLKVGILLAQVYGPRPLAGWAWPQGQSGRLAGWRSVAAPLLVLAVPLGITEMAWSGGTFLYNVVFQKLGDGALAAAQIVNTLESIFIVGSLGLMSATTALVGRSLGRGDAPGAVAWIRRLLAVGLRTGAAFGLLFALSALLLGLLFREAGAEVRSMAALGILINSAFQIVKVRNMIVGAGILPSGNDTGGVILGDVVSAFLVGLPLAVLLGLYTPLGVTGVFLARVTEESVKMGIFAWRAGRLKWERLAAEQGGAQKAAA